MDKKERKELDGRLRAIEQKLADDSLALAQVRQYLHGTTYSEAGLKAAQTHTEAALAECCEDAPVDAAQLSGDVLACREAIRALSLRVDKLEALLAEPPE